MKRIYIVFLAVLLAGCTMDSYMEAPKSNNSPSTAQAGTVDTDEPEMDQQEKNNEDDYFFNSCCIPFW